MTVAHYVLASAALTLAQLVAASMLRAKAWTPSGLKLAFGNRETMPPVGALAGRADRAAKNMLENMVLLLAVVVAAAQSASSPSRLALGSAIFFWARLAYVPLYLAGVQYARTLAWAVALAGIGWAACGAL
ncbi:MAG: MAPEG family protein [Myxococcales bacterium]|nr:MAPEG family protein [Myxococcales bacterium]